MTDKVITNFNLLFPLMMSGIVNDVTPDVDPLASEDDESVIEEFKLKAPRDLNEVLDIIEDGTDFILVYVAKRRNNADETTHVLAVTNAIEGHMNKINLTADTDGKVHSITATLYESQDIFAKETLSDVKEHIAQKFNFEYMIPEEELRDLLW